MVGVVDLVLKYVVCVVYLVVFEDVGCCLGVG